MTSGVVTTGSTMADVVDSFMASVTVTLAVKLPGWVGVPVTSPELATTDRPGGNPVALQV
jgi:hypothetical protein